MAEDFNLPHWGLGDGDPDKNLSERLRQIQENFEEIASQTARRLRAQAVQPPTEALAEVSTSSATPVALSGGPSVTVACRPGLMIAVLADVEHKNATASGDVVAELDGSGMYVAGANLAVGAAYARYLSGPYLTGGTYPAGALGVFPATATSHTIELKYSATGGGTSFFKNRRLWAWVL